MIKILSIALLSTLMAIAQDNASVSKIDAKIKHRMLTGKSWKASCPVPLKNLRYLRLPYIDFSGQAQRGEMIVHKDVANNVVAVFASLYDIKYPIRKIRLVSDYKGSDWQSIEADNTSAFNCRAATGSKKWSKHSYGKAIDINPIENPYVFRSGRSSHKASKPFIKRRHSSHTAKDRALLLRKDAATQIFIGHGWKWGADFKGAKDYQHFYK